MRVYYVRTFSKKSLQARTTDRDEIKEVEYLSI